MHEGWIRVASVTDVPHGEARVVDAGGRSLALCNVDGEFHAIDNTCPHRGGPLGEGDLEGRVLTCPWHAWRWDVTTGANVNNPAVKLRCARVHVEGQEIFVDPSRTEVP
jgi:3-phenylpropionate/trans-cinnamate dioxygenase ferredoxin component